MRKGRFAARRIFRQHGGKRAPSPSTDTGEDRARTLFVLHTGYSTVSHGGLPETAVSISMHAKHREAEKKVGSDRRNPRGYQVGRSSYQAIVSSPVSLVSRLPPLPVMCRVRVSTVRLVERSQLNTRYAFSDSHAGNVDILVLTALDRSVRE